MLDFRMAFGRKAVLIAASVMLVLSGCEADQHALKQSSSSQKNVSREEVESSPPSTYHFRFKQEDVAGIVEVLINGFPVNRGGGSVTNNPVVPLDLNTALVGTDNKLTIRVEPRLYKGEKLSITEVKVYGKVTRDEEGRYLVPGARITKAEVDSAYWTWSKQAQKKWSSYQSSVGRGAFDSMKAWVERHPLVLSTTFDNETGPDFSQIFEEAPKLKGTPATRRRLKDYAMHLRDLMVAKDTSALFEEFRPAIEDRFEAGSFPSRKQFMQQNREAVVMEDPILDFGREDIRLRSWCEGRLWQLILEGGKNGWFFQTASGFGRGKMYVAEVNGELKVVRQG